MYPQSQRGNMTAKEMVPAIGATVEIATGIGNLTVQCRVTDVKMSWGQPRLLVKPVAGSGSSWVELSRLRMPTQGVQAC